MSAARNRGVSLSAGALVAFIDADDLWLPGKLAAQVACLRDNPQAGAVMTQLDCFVSNPDDCYAHTRYAKPIVSLVELMIHHVIGNGSNLLIRRTVFDAVSGFSEGIHHAEDWEFAVRACRHAPILSIPTVHGLYRLSPKGASRQLVAMGRGHRNAIKSLQASGFHFDANTRRQMTMVHANYVAGQALLTNTSVWGSAVGFSQLVKALIVVRGRPDERRAAGLVRDRVVYRARSLMRQASARLAGRLRLMNPTRLGYSEQGFVAGTHALADPSVIPALLEDADVFRQELDRYRREAIEYRVPYLLTESIRQVAADDAIVSMLDRLYGKHSPWVMWGANIRDGIPNQAGAWHVDAESRFWGTVTVVIGLSGCTENNASKFIPYSHRHGAMPQHDTLATDHGGILEQASRLDPRSNRIVRFDHFGNGRFYAFNAAGWHCGDPADGAHRTLLFLHYQRARHARVPYMDNYLKGTWQNFSAPYVFSGDLPVNRIQPGRLNTRLQLAPGSAPDASGGISAGTTD